MGILSKVWKKTVGKVWKKTGKMIKSAVMKIGKFMNKIGIVGQIALGLLLPGIGSALGAWAGTASTNIFAAGAKSFINAAINIGTKASAVFKTVTQGITKVVGQTVGTVLNKAGLGDTVTKMGWDIADMKNFGGKGGVFETAGNVLNDSLKAGKDLFSMDTLTGTNKYAVKAQLEKSMKGMTLDNTFKDTGSTTFADGTLDGTTIQNVPSMELAQPDLTKMGTSLDTAVGDIGNQDFGYKEFTAESFDLTKPAEMELGSVGSIDEYLPKGSQITELDPNIMETAEQTTARKAQELLGNKVKPDSFLSKVKDKTQGAVITTGLQAVGLKESMTPIDQRRSFGSTTVLDNSQTQMFTSDSSMLNNSLSTYMGGDSSNFGGQIGHGAFLYNAEQADMEFQRALAAQQGGAM
jgi:hypothetical protein